MLFVVKTVRTNLKAPRSLLEIHLCNDGGEYSGVVKTPTSVVSNIGHFVQPVSSLLLGLNHPPSRPDPTHARLRGVAFT